MCELYGVTSKKSIKMNNILKDFFKHSYNHPHGWGLAIDGREDTLIKEGKPAYESEILKEKFKEDIVGKLAIAHIRYATCGEICERNSHPFIRKDILGNTWTLAHNGTATEGDLVEKYKKYAYGETDSETILIFLIKRINKAIILNNSKELSIKQKGDVIQKAIKDITFKNRINLLFTDGENLFVHCNLKDSLYSYHKEGHIVFATTPLNKFINDWHPIKINTLFIYNGDKLIYEGEAHKNEYIKPELRAETSYVI